MKELYIRNFQESDKEFLILKNSYDFNTPDVDNPLFFVKKVITDQEGNIIGIGVSRLTCEAIFILDKDKPVVTLARAAKELTHAMVSEGKYLGMDESHAFVDDVKFAGLLKKHLGFVNSKGGQVLYLDFDNV